MAVRSSSSSYSSYIYMLLLMLLDQKDIWFGVIVKVHLVIIVVVEVAIVFVTVHLIGTGVVVNE